MISFKSMIGKNKEQGKEPEAKSNKESIFGKTLQAGKMVQDKKAKYLESKNKKMAYAKLGGSFIALAAYSVFFFYGVIWSFRFPPPFIQAWPVLTVF